MNFPFLCADIIVKNPKISTLVWSGLVWCSEPGVRYIEYYIYIIYIYTSSFLPSIMQSENNPYLGRPPSLIAARRMQQRNEEEVLIKPDQDVKFSREDINCLIFVSCVYTYNLYIYKCCVLFTGNQTCHPGAPFGAPGVTVLRPRGIFLYVVICRDKGSELLFDQKL